MNKPLQRGITLEKLSSSFLVQLHMKTCTHRKPLKIFALIGLFFLILFALSVYLQLELPQPTGPYAVGRAIFKWVDTSRPEIMTENPKDFREVMVLVWYPAVKGTGIQAEYIPDLPAITNDLAYSGELEGWEAFGLRWVRSNSFQNAKPLREAAPYPGVLLLPGNGTNIEFYSSLASEIASHGYIVIGINHPYYVTAVELSNGKVAPYDKEQWSLDLAAHQAYIAKRHKVKVGDALFVLDQLRVLNSSASSRVAGILDLKNMVAGGHARGGIVASDVCKAVPDIKACLNFDGLQKGGPFSMEETALPPTQPFLFLTKEEQLHPKLLERFESMPESYWIVVHGASHQSFTDGPTLQPSLFPGPNQADRLMSFIQQYSLAFLDQTLKGKSSDLLSKTVADENVSVNVFHSH